MDDLGFDHSGDENGSPRKGGHTLRRRARVDYTSENIEDEPVVPNSTSTSRTRKRRSDNSNESQDSFNSALHRRRASVDADTPSRTRRNPARKTSEIKSYNEDNDDDELDLNDQDPTASSVQDTIEVHGSDPGDTSHSSRSRNSDPGPLGPSAGSPELKANVSSPSQQLFRAASSELALDPVLLGDADEIAAQQLQEEASEAKAEDMDTTTPGEQLATEQLLPTTPASESRAEASEPAEKDVPSPRSEQQADANAQQHAAADVTAEHVEEAASPQKADAAEVTATDENSQDILMQDAPALSSPSAKQEHDVPAEVTDPAPEANSLGTMSAEVSNDSTAEDDVPTVTLTNTSDRAETPVIQEFGRSTTPKPSLAPSSILRKPQPTPEGKWAHLTPYLEGEFVTYPEKKEASPDEDTQAEDTAQEDKDANDVEPMVEDNDDAPDPSSLETPTPALATPTRGSPVPDSMEPTASNSPAPGMDDGDDGDMSDSQDDEIKTYFRYRKLRDADDYLNAIENYEDMTTTELYELLEAINVSMIQWQSEWTGLGKVVDDYENASRRRVADAKYEARTRNLDQNGINYEEPEFVVKGYKAKEREVMSETRYLQGQDRIMAAAYGFEYDPHPSKIGRQNPESQQVGIMTRGRSLRNQPRQTAKATEGEEVVGKRQRKPVQLFDPAPQDVSRSSTPVPGGRTRRRRNLDDDVAGSTNGDAASEMDEPPSRTRRQRGNGRGKTSAPDSVLDFGSQETVTGDDAGRSGRRGRGRGAAPDDDEPDNYDDDPRDYKHPRRHLLTLKIPRGNKLSEPSSAITDNGDSRPSTADSDSSSHTAESSYSFRPKRQKRFREELEESESAGGQEPPKKSRKRYEENAGDRGPRNVSRVGPKKTKVKLVHHNADPALGGWKMVTTEVPISPTGDKTSSSVGNTDAEEPKKDYKLMTKSEKMSASMKSRWANGNMAGAVEKRKATLAAKKAAQATADQKGGAATPKSKATPKPKKPSFTPKPEAQQPPPSHFHSGNSGPAGYY